MRVGITLLPEQDWARDVRRWQRAEAYGFDHAWTFDHLAWRTLADSPWHATIPTLVAAALSTTTLRIGTWVATPNFRHPVPLAKELMTLDSMSGGRLNVGLGTGARGGWDAAMLGQPELTLAQTTSRFREFVTLLDLLLRQSHTTWRGEWFSAVEARNLPGPVQRPRPPFIVASNGPRGMALALTRGDAWATLGTTDPRAGLEAWWDGVREASERFEQVSATLPGPREDFARFLNVEPLSDTMTSLEAFRDCVGRAGALGFTDIVLPWPRATEPFAGDEALLDDIADELGRRPAPGPPEPVG